MRFDGGINLLFHLVLSFRILIYAGGLCFARGIQFFASRPKNVNAFFSFLKIGPSTPHYETSEKNPNCWDRASVESVHQRRGKLASFRSRVPALIVPVTVM